MSAPKNWLGRQNPWNLRRPPSWWLRKLERRDPDLRVLPGLKEPCYRVARVSAAMQRITPILGNDSETGRMCREGVVPVVSLRPTVAWNDDFFVWLDAHDTWTIGGGEKAAEQVESLERDAAAQLQAASDDEADQRGASAYFARLVRQGSVAFVRGATQSAG